MFEAYNDVAHQTIRARKQPRNSSIDKFIIKEGDINPSYMSINIKVNNTTP